MSRAVKIRRTVGIDGERFWLNNVRLVDGKLLGEVDSHLELDHGFSYGQTIDITGDEIIEEVEIRPTVH